jgi:COX assembly protein 2
MPALIESEHPACAALIRDYKHCSKTASLLSKIIFTECTTLKYRLDACFRQEKVDRTKRNIKRGKVRSQFRSKSSHQIQSSCLLDAQETNIPNSGGKSRIHGLSFQTGHQQVFL